MSEASKPDSVITTDEPVLRRTTRDDVDAVARFLAANYEDNPKADPDVMRWQYWGNPYGGSLAMVFEAGGDIICHSACVYVPAQAGSERLMVSVGADSATADGSR